MCDTVLEQTVKAKQKRGLPTCTYVSSRSLWCRFGRGSVGVGIDSRDLVGNPEDPARANPGLDPNIENQPQGELGGNVYGPDGAIPDSGPGI